MPSLYRPSTDGLMITKAITQYLNHLSMNQHRVLFKHSVIIMAARVMHFPSALVPVSKSSDHSALFTMDKD